MSSVVFIKCPVCGSVWPASTTIEAYNNRKRAARLHPAFSCKDAEKFVLGHTLTQEQQKAIDSVLRAMKGN